MENSEEHPELSLGVAEGSVSIRVKGVECIVSPETALQLARGLFEAGKVALVGEPAEWQRCLMYYLILEVGSGDEPVAGIDVAENQRVIAHCWIKDQTFVNALHVACGWLNHDGWDIEAVLYHREVHRNDFEGDEFLEYFDQALSDEQVFCFEVEDQ